MILEPEKSIIEQSGTSEETQFTIKATASAFSILSSGLYSDKILAIVRELSANAYDSHIAVGNQSTPIEVKLPSMFDPTFYVKDFGIGLSHEQVISLYSTYFDSTKQGSNDFIGALGLGSKSPFSYTTAFSVESCHGGIRRIYSCFINENQLPSIVKLGEVEMEQDEQTGMTISMSAKPDDYGRFAIAAKKSFMYYDPLPNVVGCPQFAPYSVSHTITGSNWRIRTSDYQAHMDGPYIVQGFIAYPIDSEAIKTYGLSTNALALAHVGIDFTVPIGMVEVAASREALSYTKQTTVNIASVFEVAALEIYDSFQSSFANCKNKWEVGLLYEELSKSSSTDFSQLFQRLHAAQPFMWNGEVVTDEITLDLEHINNLSISRVCVTNRGGGLSTVVNWDPSRDSRTFRLPIGKGVRVMVDTDRVSTRDTYRRYLTSLTTTRNTLLVIKPLSKNKCIDAIDEISSILEQLGMEGVVYANDIVKPKQANTTKVVRRKKTERLCWIHYKKQSYQGFKFSKHSWNVESIDPQLGGLYVPINRYTPCVNITKVGMFGNLIEAAIELNIIGPHARICGLPLLQVDNLPSTTTWVNVVDLIITEFNKIIKQVEHSIIATHTTHDMKSCMGYYGYNKLVSIGKAELDNIPPGAFKEFIQDLLRLDELSSQVNEEKYKYLNHISTITNMPLVTGTTSATWYERWTSLQDIYPMMQFVATGALTTEESFLKIVNYVKLIDIPAIDFNK